MFDGLPFFLAFGLTGAAIYLAFRFAGLRAALGTLVAALPILALLWGRKEGKKEAIDVIKRESMEAQLDSMEKAHEARIDAAVRDADPERLRDDDGFRRD